MRGLLHVRIPLLVRRLVTLIPALVILVIGFDPTLALVLSQVVLSFGIPFALIPLVRLTSLKTLLGESANRWWTTVLAGIAAVLLIALNATLLALVVTGS
jgi:manganese transport protein